jgi:hypothetical protein
MWNKLFFSNYPYNMKKKLLYTNHFFSFCPQTAPYSLSINILPPQLKITWLISIQELNPNKKIILIVKVTLLSNFQHICLDVLTPNLQELTH